MVRIHYLPPPAETAPELGERGEAGPCDAGAGGVTLGFTKHGPLDENQVAQLAAHFPAPAGAPRRMDDVSRRMLEALRCDGRATVEELMAATSASASTIRRRMQLCGPQVFCISTWT